MAVMCHIKGAPTGAECWSLKKTGDEIQSENRGVIHAQGPAAFIAGATYVAVAWIGDKNAGSNPLLCWNNNNQGHCTVLSLDLSSGNITMPGSAGVSQFTSVDVTAGCHWRINDHRHFMLRRQHWPRVMPIRDHWRS